jgi:hypothetical protein
MNIIYIVRNLKTGRIMKQQKLKSSIAVNFRRNGVNIKRYLNHLLIFEYGEDFENVNNMVLNELLTICENNRNKQIL